MGYDYSKLKGRIVEKYGTQDEFSKAMGLSRTTLSNKLSNKSGWSDVQIEKAIELLDIPRKEISVYFFKRDVQVV